MKKYNKKAGDAYYYCFANAPPTASNSIIISPWKTLSPLLPPTITKDIGKSSLLLEYDMVPYSPTKRNRYIYTPARATVDANYYWTLYGVE